VLFEFADFTFDESAFELRRSGALVKADPKVLDVLAYVLRKPGQLVSKHELMEHVWEGRALSDTVLTGAMSRLRKALEGDGGDPLLENVYGRGYRFTAAVTLRAPVSLPPPIGNAERSTNDLPFVGRGAALARVETALEQARKGWGRLVVAAGEPGIGKTHLAEVSTERASALGMPWAWGVCRPRTICPPFWPLIQVLRGCGRASSGAPQAAIERSIALLMPGGTTPAGWGDATPSLQLFDEVTRTLHALTEEVPWLLVLDDLQWADAASLHLLAYLAPEIARMRLVILGTARDTERNSGDDELAPVLGHRNCETVALARLSQADVDEYTALRLGDGQGQVSRAVFAKSEGNPFFMVELLRPFGRSSLPNSVELALPGPALDIVRQRVRVLSAETIAVLSAAALVGRDFDLALVSHVVDRGPEQVLDLLESAREARIVFESSGRADHFVFGHDLIRSALLDDMPATHAARLHLRVAEALERRYPVGSASPRQELVHHLLSALPLGDVKKAVEYAQRSAREAASLYAYADAAALLRRALAALDLAEVFHPRLRCEVLFGLALCERLSVDSRFSEHLAEAITLGREHILGDILAEAARHMTYAPGSVDLPGARGVLEAALRALPPEEKALRAEVLARLSWAAPHCFDAQRAASLIERAEALARESGNTAVLETVLSSKLYFASGPDTEGLARSISDQIEELRRERSHVNPAAWPAQVAYTGIVVCLQRADMEGVARHTAALAAVARQYKRPDLEWHHRRADVIHRMNRGEFGGVENALSELRDWADRARLFGRHSACAVDWGVFARETGAATRSSTHNGAMRPEDSDYPFRRARKIRVLAEAGAIESARAVLHELPPESLSRLPLDRDYLATLVHLAVASLTTDSAKHVEALYALLSPYPHLFAADLSLHCDGSVAHFLGLLANALGHTGESLEHFERGLSANDRAGFKGRAAHSAYELGRALVTQGSGFRDRARTLIARALEESRQMGMRPLGRQAEELLRTL
jgi:DNA-binding winged helix-turn-helix (wHTH) protein/tetratricopeptide (TPR) repeat protein